MRLYEGMGASVALLGFTAPDVAAGGAQPKVEAAAALLAASGLGLRKGLRNVFA